MIPVPVPHAPGAIHANTEAELLRKTKPGGGWCVGIEDFPP